MRVKVPRGSLNERDFVIALETIASQIAKGTYFSYPDNQREFFYSQGYDGRTWEQTLFSPDNRKLARFVFHKSICPKMFMVRIKAGKKIGQSDYNLLDKIVGGLFGKFERVNAYGPDEKPQASKAQPKSQPCQHEQLDLFQPAR